MLAQPAPRTEIIARRDEIVAALRDLLPPESVIGDPLRLKPYETDGLSAYREPPLAVALPSTTEQVAAILAYCHREGIRVVPRGAGTSLSGGALPMADSVVLGLMRMNRILDISYPDRCATVQAGVTNIGITQAVAQNGFFYAPDPSSQLACMIGGNVNMNSGGDAVTQAVGAAGVHVDIAADHAGELAGGVGGIEEAAVLHRLGDADIGDAGLDGGAAVGVVDVEDAVQAHQAEHDRIDHRQGAAGERGAGAAGDDAHALAVAEGQDGGDLFGGAGQGDGEGDFPIRAEAVGFVGLEAQPLGDHGVVRQEVAQAGDDLVAAGENVGLGGWLGKHGGLRESGALCAGGSGGARWGASTKHAPRRPPERAVSGAWCQAMAL